MSSVEAIRYCHTTVYGNRGGSYFSASQDIAGCHCWLAQQRRRRFAAGEDARDAKSRTANAAFCSTERGVAARRVTINGCEPVDHPVRFAEVFATLYHNLGIDVERTTARDLHGRPQYLVDGGAGPI